MAWQMAPKTLKIWLILAAAAYFLLPYDLLPDFLGLPGRVDDVLVMAWLAWLYRTKVQPQGSQEAHRAASGRNGAGQGEGRRGSSSRAGGNPRDPGGSPDAYEVLGVARGATEEAIRTAYRARMQEYHPDKVAHLGEDLQKLALEKSQQIQRAYRQLHR